MRDAVLVLIVIAVAAVAAQPQLVPIIPVQATSLRAASSPAPTQCAPTPRIDPAALGQPLTEMSPQERANAELLVAANSSEARQAEALWNRGEYGAAIAALQRWAEKADLRHVYVGFNWRVPIQSGEADWGTNVRVGTRDSAYRMAFDRENSTGNLLVTSLCLAGANTDFVVNLSTDGGSSWTETHTGFWSGAAVINDLEMTGSAGYEYVAYLDGWYPDTAYCLRIDAATGAYVKLPDSSWHKPVLKTSLPGDTLDEVAITSTDDQLPGDEIEVVGGTRQHRVEAGYSGDQGANWGLYTAWGGQFYWGGLDYCYNHYDSGGVDRYVFFSCIFSAAGQYYPAYAYYDTMWNGFYLPIPTKPFVPMTSQTTGIAAWKDTIVLAYPHLTDSGVAVRCVVSYDAFGHYAHVVDLTDSLGSREDVAICGRHGDGVSVVWREFGTGSDRWVFHRHSDYAGATWTEPDTVSDHRPDWVDRPRIQRVAPGVYGVCYITFDGGEGSLWFNREDWGGIAGPTPERIVPLGLVAAPHRGGARLSFTNPVAGPVRLALYDVAGRSVLSRTELLKPGAQALDCAVPASGSYIAVLKTPAVTATTKFSTLK